MTHPAMPELPEPVGELRSDEFEGHIFEPTADKWPFKEPLYTADQMRAYALAALQSQPAEVSDAEIDRICYLATEIRFAKTDDAAQAVIDKIRAILALRPQAVPMTDEQLCAALGIDGSDDWTYKVRDVVEAHHGITAHGAEGGM